MGFSNETVTKLEVLERDRKTFTHPDPILESLIECESKRLKDAAQMIGREWNGMFSRTHVLLIARAYINSVKDRQP